MSAPDATSSSPDRLPRRLGFWATTAVMIGTIIGSGIFRVPATVAVDVGSVAGIAAVWVLGGVIALCGALAIAELAAALPQSGGVFVYLREAYGPAVAFVYGWAMLFLSPAGTAGLALVFAEYLGTLVPLSPAGVRLVAAGAIVVVAAAGYRSVRGAGAIQSAATVGKVAALTALVVAAFLLGDGDVGALGRGAPAASEARWGGVGLGLVAALWAYNGFQDMVCIAGEVRDPGRVLPRALLVGTAVVISIYLAANAAYLYVLPYAALRASPLVASDAMVRVLGTAGAGAVAAMVMISTFGALNGLVLTQPRVFYAMAAEGLLFAPLARVHPRFGTPHVAVASFALVALACVWSRTFEQLTEAFVLGIWPFLALAAAGVLVLRRTRPDLARPYRTPGYPAVPLVFVAGTLWIVGSALVARPVTTLAGVGLRLLGVPVYLVWRAARRRAVTGGARVPALRARQKGGSRL
jgi:basic amino acid/polyamine antiporter, APA family